MASLSQTQVIAISGAIGLAIAYFIYKSNKESSSAKSNDSLPCPASPPKATDKTINGDNRLMKLNSTKQIKVKLPPKFALVTDLDHTLFGANKHETHSQSNQHILQFNDIWCTQYAPKNCVLIYATGRNFEKYQLAVTEWDILKPDILVSADGISIHWFNKSLAQQVQAKSTHKIDMSFDDTMDTTNFLWYDRSYEALLSEGWDQEFAELIHEEVSKKFQLLPLPQKSKSCESFRIGVLVQGLKLAKEIEEYYMKRVNEYNEENKDKSGFNRMEIHTFTCVERNLKDNDEAYWSAFTPEKAGKGSAIEFLRRRLHLQTNKIICMGDSGNDISMLGIDGYNSVIMENSSQELLNFYKQKTKGNGDNDKMIKTTKPKTLGVIQGLQFYGPRLLK